MFKRFSTNYIVLLFLSDSVIIQLALWLAFQLRFMIPLGQTVRPEWVSIWIYAPTVSMLVAVGSLWAVCFTLNSAYTPRKIILWVDEFQRIIMAHTIAALWLAGLLYLANIPLLRLVFIYFYVIALFLLLFLRTLLRIWHQQQPQNSNSIARILIVGAGPVGNDIVEEFQASQWPGVELVGYLDDDPQKQSLPLELPILGTVDQAVEIIEGYNIDEIIVALPRHAHHKTVNLVAYLSKFPVRLRVVPDYFDLAFHGATIESLGGIPLIGLRDPAIDGFQRLIKRLIDILFSSIGLLILSPLMALIAMLIKLQDGGPILYAAPRVGENGNHFNMYKFRSMIIGADSLQEHVNASGNKTTLFHKDPDDPRVTSIGRFIRRASIDELPQLLNVWKGEMSLVGPRPELPWLVKEYEPWQRKRLAVPQGMTGWWQVNGRSDNLMHLHTEQDLYYIQNHSFWLDLQILWRTIPVVLRGKGAY